MRAASARRGGGERKVGSEILNRRVKTLDAEAGVPVFCVGTVYRDMAAKPNLLDEANRDLFDQRSAEEESVANAAKYCGEDDGLLLEDESGRLALRLPAALTEGLLLVTGSVIGVTGSLGDNGELEVDGVCFPGLPPQPAAPPREATAVASSDLPSEGRYVALVSGLRVGDDVQAMLPLQLLAEHLTGQLGCDEDHRMQANIVRLIVAGNATSTPSSDAGDASSTGASATGDVLKKLAPPQQKHSAQHVRTLDQFLTAVCAAIPTDLMPGAEDPCNFLLPQQRFHPCMLPHSAQLSSLNLCTNPYCSDIDGVRVLGTSGQPLDDMQKYVPGNDRLGTLAKSLELQHLAPTAPDTLGCYPFDDATSDPFVVDECPRVFFAGNQPRFESTLVEGAAGQKTRVVMVPDFSKEPVCVLVDLDTLECKSVAFAGLDAATDMQI